MILTLRTDLAPQLIDWSWVSNLLGRRQELSRSEYGRSLRVSIYCCSINKHHYFQIIVVATLPDLEKSSGDNCQPFEDPSALSSTNGQL